MYHAQFLVSMSAKDLARWISETEAVPQPSMTRVKAQSRFMHACNMKAKRLLAIQHSNRKALEGEGI